MSRIGQRARGVVDGYFGALRLSDRAKNGGADSRRDGHTQDRHSGETHTRLLSECRHVGGLSEQPPSAPRPLSRADYDSGQRGVNRRIEESLIRTGRGRHTKPEITAKYLKEFGSLADGSRPEVLVKPPFPQGHLATQGVCLGPARTCGVHQAHEPSVCWCLPFSRRQS